MKYFINQYGENNCVSTVIYGVHRQGCGAYEIERRPRGASRMNPLLHLLQRAEPVRPWLPALAQGLRQVGRRQCPPKNRVERTRLTTMAYQAWPRCNKCRSGFIRDAPRGRRSIS
ncbi:hypothetical protein HU751_005365 [Pseudomonas sp. BW13M1]|uniref:hypothetical protein n=1 Tax=Pseudomonas peradeniyensis TaxID=2745488 RepID=UPI001C3C85AE|nr:hypothetical protein [Pseudomonas peradeniyensis]MBV4504268.1 hypothetical protein [Pseudomonas peradeniyensis]